MGIQYKVTSQKPCVSDFFALLIITETHYKTYASDSNPEMAEDTYDYSKEQFRHHNKASAQIPRQTAEFFLRMSEETKNE